MPDHIEIPNPQRAERTLGIIEAGLGATGPQIKRALAPKRKRPLTRDPEHVFWKVGHDLILFGLLAIIAVGVLRIGDALMHLAVVLEAIQVVGVK